MGSVTALAKPHNTNNEVTRLKGTSTFLDTTAGFLKIFIQASFINQIIIPFGSKLNI
jgi:uncharacterized membrane protein